MTALTETAAAPDPPWDIIAPAEHTVPLVIASPHSGRRYPPEFLASSRLDIAGLRRSEDGFVDEIFATAAPGAPLLRALFPRAYVDPNREPFELDPGMFEDELPAYVNTASPRAVAGLGTVARLVANGQDIYDGKLTFAEAERRVETMYRPYHAALRQLLDETQARFGCYLLIDCHSMPSIGGPMESDSGRRRPDFVLGDCFGASCDIAAVATAEATLRSLGYQVARNIPFSGGFTTRHYGRPEMGMHALQLEVNRALYMNEQAFEKKPAIADLKEHMAALLAALGSVTATLRGRE